ncbi:hypothetical protein [Halalkalibacterium halodurans]|uniref:hypothetical protein n=1 Tax=Halalkalibacterium halodurans TaxID=86665 RepID=UPI002AAA3815|nr:hypothetical protein [Halalkalibacterium halodurans]MDY7224681.1 hypothetical protein [Halalkalibacterium halodurans]MDY7243269.1 hypothetical protein [Halalkalibacterium halodurans]
MAAVPGMYDYPSKSAYLHLVNYEAFAVQMAEIHKRNGFLDEAKAVLRVKNQITIQRICMKAALKLKEKSQQQETLYGLKTAFAIIDEVAEKG